MRRILAAMLLLIVPAAAAGQGEVPADWATPMFKQTTHDFGMVARGTKAEFRFSFENPYVEDVHIKSFSSSCKCTEVQVIPPLVKTHETGEIVATLDTRTFTGRKDATIRVVIDRPYPAEVQLHIHSYIRTDIVLEPGSVRFGDVREGKSETRRITLTHAGSPDWKITGVENKDPHLGVTLRALPRSSARAAYELTFTLKETAPPGYLQTPVVLRTNDINRDAQRVLVPIDGSVRASVSIRPSPVSFGIVRPGEKVTKSFVIQGEDQFLLSELRGPDDRFAFARQTKDDKGARLHLVSVTFTADAKPGKIEGDILAGTNIGGGRILRVAVDGDVVAKSATPSPATEATTPGKDESSAASAASAEEKSSDGWHSADK